MVQASEIRIGNLLRYPNGKIFKVELSDFLNNDFWEDVADNIEPIRLTPELLVKCGFVLHPWGWVKKSSADFGVRLHPQSFGYDVSGNNPVRLKHLHQLQNLYFALTGEELTVNLGTTVEAS